MRIFFFCLLYSFVVSKAYGNTFVHTLETANEENELEECPDTRLDTEGKSMHGMPIYDQGNTDMCYAYSASQMLDAVRFRRGDKRKKLLTNPLVLALKYKMYKGELAEGFGFGDVRRTLYEGLRDEVCLSNKENFDFNLRSNEIDHAFPLLSIFQKKKNEENVYVSDMLSAEKDIYKLAKSNNVDICPETDDEIAVEVKAKKMLDFLLEVAEKMSEQELADVSISDKCDYEKFDDRSPYYPIETYARERRHFPGLIWSFDRINKQLRFNKPVTISYCSEVLKDNSFEGLKVGRESGERCGTGSSHASLIVGARKTKSGSCEYLIRNTWGKSCKKYDWECENGQIWVGMDELGKNLFNITYLDEEVRDK